MKLLKLPTILIGYVLLALVYSWATPVFESSDEYKHFPVVAHIHSTGKLVELDPANEGKWKQEGAQPPLYYLMMAAATAWIDTSDLDQVHIENRHAFIGNPAQHKNKNLVFHDPVQERFPWSGSILAVFVIRLLSIGLGGGTLWFGYLTAKLFFDETEALMMVTLTAFNPMFLFISAAVNNDSLSAMLGAAGLFVLLTIWLRQSRQAKPRFLRKHYIVLGVICGLAMLTKLSLATLLLLGGLVTLQGMILAWQQRNRWGDIIKPAESGLITLTIALVLVGPWLLRNLHLYGDLTGLTPFIEVQGTRDNPTLLGVDWVAEFGTFFRSFWGLFGGVNVFGPQWFYTVCNLLFLIGMAGLIWQLVKKPQSLKHFTLPALMVSITMILLIRWTIISPAFQGRLLFPALIGVNLLWVKGMQISSGKWQVAQLPLYPLLSTLFFPIMAVLIPFTHIAPTYAYPEPLAQVPAAAEFGPILFEADNGESLSLVGVEIEPGQVAFPGDQRGVVLTLYWTTETGASTNYVTAVHALGRELESMGQVDRHPGWGMWPPTRWEPGEIYADQYHVWVNENDLNPALLRMSVSVTDTSIQPKETLTAKSPAGDKLELVLMGEAKLGDTQGLEDIMLYKADPNPVDFDDFVTLVSFSPLGFLEAKSGTFATITVHWVANGTPSTDYTVFVQLVDGDGNLVASGDAPPLNGDYPTGLWEAGESIIDPKSIQIPADIEPGTYQIFVGLYDPITGARMQRLDGGDSISQTIEIK